MMLLVQVHAYARRLRCPRCGRAHCRVIVADRARGVLGRRCTRLVRGVCP